VELLIVLAIIAILAGILFPVFRAAINAARQSACLQHYSQAAKATLVYCDEYNGRFPPANYHAYLPPPAPVDPDDRTWVQLVSQYTRSLEVFECPADFGRGHDREIGPGDDMDVAPNDDWGAFYIRSLRSNIGFNYMYLSPLGSDSQNVWRPRPLRATDPQFPSETLMLVDSVWGVDKQGRPYGGGQWLVVPPCRYYNNTSDGGNAADSLPQNVDLNQYMKIAPDGWDLRSYSSAQYGGAWSWHAEHFTIAYVDGHVNTVSLGRLTDGCEIRKNFAGLIQDKSRYLWDLDRYTW